MSKASRQQKRDRRQAMRLLFGLFRAVLSRDARRVEEATARINAFKDEIEARGPAQ